jgi:hypothetical protein
VRSGEGLTGTQDRPGQEQQLAHDGGDHDLPLIETAVERLRTQQIIAPGITTLERLVWSVQRLAQRRVERLLMQPCSR